jgi:hypothetical protein
VSSSVGQVVRIRAESVGQARAAEAALLVATRITNAGRHDAMPALQLALTASQSGRVPADRRCQVDEGWDAIRRARNIRTSTHA